MSICQPKALREFLDQLSIRPKRGLSQNFLIDGNILQKIVQTAEVKEGDLVLEIGPGPGALTEALLTKGARVIAVEKDPILGRALNRLEGPLEVIIDDALQFPIEHLGERCKVIANLPYQVTSRILRRYLPENRWISSLTLMMQKEVAERIVAKPQTSEYGLLSLATLFYGSARYGFTVKKQCFYPPPKVDSAVVRIDLKEPPKVKNEEAFFPLLRQAFGQRRKMLRASLTQGRDRENVVKALEVCFGSTKPRPQDIDLDGFIRLHEALL